MSAILTVDHGVRPWAERMLDTTFRPDVQFITRLREDGTAWGVCVYENFTEHDCIMHMAGEPGWINRSMARHAFTYPFLQLGLARVTGLVDEKNERVLKMDLKMGFQVEGRIRRGLGDSDIILLGMLKDECRYI